MDLKDLNHLKKLTSNEYSQAREKLFRIIKCGHSDIPHGYERISLIKQKNWFAVKALGILSASARERVKGAITTLLFNCKPPNLN